MIDAHDLVFEFTDLGHQHALVFPLCVILSVFLQIAFCTSFGDLFGDLRKLGVFQSVDLGFDFVVPFAGHGNGIYHGAAAGMRDG